MMRTVQRLVMSGTCLLLLYGQAAAQSRALGHDNFQKNKFRYVIVEDRIDDDPATGPRRRVVEVLLDEKTYSEPTLRELFALLSKRFSADEILDVMVYTNLAEVPTPEERDAGTSSGKSGERKTLYYWAFYLRSPNDEFFRYAPLNNKAGVKTVQLRKRGN